MGKGMHAHLAPTQCMKSTKARVWAVQQRMAAWRQVRAALLRQAALCRRCALCMGGRPWWQPLVLRSAMQLRRFGCPGQHPSGHVSGIA